jgi:hypothetical protein
MKIFFNVRPPSAISPIRMVLPPKPLKKAPRSIAEFQEVSVTS